MQGGPAADLNRRVLLQLAAASAALGACKPTHAEKPKHIAVIGGGIIGTSIAFHLAREGAHVSLLERGGLAERASRGTFAWINATWAKQPRHYHQFNQQGLSGWKRLQTELDIPVRWGGSLEWFPSPQRQIRLADQIAEQVAWGEPAEMLPLAAVAELEPYVQFGDAAQVAYSPNDGAVDPVLASRMLAEGARKAGALIKENCDVETVARLEGGRVELQTSRGGILCDTFVLATGADPQATQTLAGIDIPQRSTPGVIVVTKPLPRRVITRIIVAPGVHIHQRDDGRVVLGEQDGAPDTEAHATRLEGRPNRFPDPVFADQHALRILSVAERYVPDLSSADIEDVFIG